jgi:hypothetical protein
MKTAKEVVKFRNENGRMPFNGSKNKEEKELAKWLSHIKSVKRGQDSTMVIYLSVEEYLKEEWGGDWWKDNREPEAIEQAIKFVKWIQDNKGMTPRSSSKDSEERSLATWFNNMKSANKGGGNMILYPSVGKILIEAFGEEWYLQNKVNIKSMIYTIQPRRIKIEPRRIKIEDENDYSPQQEVKSTTKSYPPLSELSRLHKEYKTLRSQNLAKKFRENPGEWNEYHRISEENERSFGEEVPYKRVIRYIQSIYKTKKRRSIVDLGCGMARVARHFLSRPELEFTNLDHVSCDEKLVEVADIAHTGLPEEESDMAILCLAMWGSNCEEYLTEAHRILDPHGGKLVIIEPSKRWDGGERLRQLLVEKGFGIEYEDVRVSDTEVLKFCMFVCSKVKK